MSIPMDLRYGVEEIEEAIGMDREEEEDKQARCGIGVSLTVDPRGRYIVTGVRDDGPAAAAAARGEIEVGDILEMVDGVCVAARISPAALTNMVVGPAQSEVRLTFSTPNSAVVLEDDGSASKSCRERDGWKHVSITRAPLAQPHAARPSSVPQGKLYPHHTSMQQRLGMEREGNLAGQEARAHLGRPQDASPAFEVEEDFGEV